MFRCKVKHLSCYSVWFTTMPYRVTICYFWFLQNNCVHAYANYSTPEIAVVFTANWFRQPSFLVLLRPQAVFNAYLELKRSAVGWYVLCKGTRGRAPPAWAAGGYREGGGCTPSHHSTMVHTLPPLHRVAGGSRRHAGEGDARPGLAGIERTEGLGAVIGTAGSCTWPRHHSVRRGP